MTGAKICGLTTPETVAAAVEGGAAYLGFNFFAKSPRYVTAARAAVLAEPARGRAKLVAVTVDPSDAELAAIVEALRPDLIQLHGRESPGRLAAVRELTGAMVIKALPIAGPEDVATAEAFAEADHLMFDAKPPAGSALPGGSGAAFDWRLLGGLELHRPWFLAGGLNATNVGEAIRITGAPLVDVSSGVESAPGVKQPALITAFLGAVRRT